MAQTIALRVLTPEGLAIEDEAVSVTAPGELGYLGILAHHAPLVTTLKPGKLTWRHASGERRERRLGEGLLEVARNRVIILTGSVSADMSRSDTASHGRSMT